MAVYTVLETTDVEKLTRDYATGNLIAFRGISEGVENSNYMLSLAGQTPGASNEEYVLTIAENQSRKDIEFIAGLLTLLRRQQLPVPAPLATGTGAIVVEIHGKPALLIPRIQGEHPLIPTIGQCQAIGSALGRIHQTTLDSDLQHTSHRSLSWMMSTAQAVKGRLSPRELGLLGKGFEALDRITRSQPALPQAIIHGDLFRDNTLFQGERLNAIIDFFSAGTGYLLFDLAVVANDWCMDGGQLDSTKLQTLLRAYSEHRPPTHAELALWPEFLQVAAMRFWVSRLAEQQRAPEASPGVLINEKNPDQYRDILLQHSTQVRQWPL